MQKTIQNKKVQFWSLFSFKEKEQNRMFLIVFKYTLKTVYRPVEYAFIAKLFTFRTFFPPFSSLLVVFLLALSSCALDVFYNPSLRVLCSLLVFGSEFLFYSLGYSVRCSVFAAVCALLQVLSLLAPSLHVAYCPCHDCCCCCCCCSSCLLAHTSRTLRSAALSAAAVAVVPFVIVVADAFSECLHATIVMQADIFSRLSRAHDVANVGFSSSCRHIAVKHRERERERWLVS